MSRIVKVVRMQLVNRLTFVWVPLLVLGGAFFLTLAIWAIVRNSGAEGPLVAGAAQAPVWYFLVIGVQALTLTFPFSQAMSVTRRDFYLGTLLTALAASAMLGLTFVVIGVVEVATNGFGMEGHFVRVVGVWEDGILPAFAFYVAVAMLAFVCGFASALVYKRFGMLWLTALLIAVAGLLLVAVWIITSTQSWGRVLEWYSLQGAGALAGWLALGTALLAAITYLPMRRIVP